MGNKDREHLSREAPAVAPTFFAIPHLHCKFLSFDQGCVKDMSRWELWITVYSVKNRKLHPEMLLPSSHLPHHIS